MTLPKSAYPEHPRAAVGAVVFKDDKVLLVRRGRPPAIGQWAIPGGNVKLGETLQEAAEREILEETGIVIRAKDPIYTFDAIVRDEHGAVQFHYVIVDLSADYIDGSPRPGDDADEVQWLDAQALDTLPVSPPTSKLLKETLRFR
jgi:ADP-ribose pyrophosphatase